MNLFNNLVNNIVIKHCYIDTVTISKALIILLTIFFVTVYNIFKLVQCQLQHCKQYRWHYKPYYCWQHCTQYCLQCQQYCLHCCFSALLLSLAGIEDAWIIWMRLHAGGAFVVRPGMLFPNSLGDQSCGKPPPLRCKILISHSHNVKVWFWYCSLLFVVIVPCSLSW